MPIFTIGIAVAAVVAPMFAVGGIFAAGSIGLFALQLGVGVGLSLLAQKIAGMKEPEEVAAVAAYGIRGRLQGGADLPRSFLMGYRATAGSLVWANTWGPEDVVDNKFITQVIALADYPLPATGLVGMWVNGEKVTIEGTAEGNKGFPITEYRFGKDDNPNLWVKFYDGTQTTVDTLCNGNASTGDRDYESTRVGRGVAYVVVTAKLKGSLWSGLPTFKFELNGAKLYDISKDSTAGGSGSHLWSNPATWGGDGDHLPVVQIYNLLRGFEYNGEWLYGLQGMAAARLPAANWIAQINKCRASVTGPGGTEPKYRSSLEIPVDSRMADAIEQLLTACQGKLSEIGGFYKIQCGAPDAASFTLTDLQILSTEEQSFTPFFGLSDTINGITANYPEPEEAWNSKPAPPLYRTDLEVLAGNRRLLADVALDAVPYANQVQRLMLESLQEAQRARRHTIVVGPEFWPAEPGDFLSWTSTRNGYIDKLFRIDGVADKGNLDVMLDMTEVDPADYDYDYSTDYVPPVIGPNTPVRPAPQPIVGFAVSAVEILGDVPDTQRPGILVEWSVDAVEDLDDVEAIAYEVRLASDSSVVLRGRTDEQEVGSVVVEGNTILPATLYGVRGRYVPSSAREVEWSSWLPVTTTDSFIGASDLTIELRTYLETELPGEIDGVTADLALLQSDLDALEVIVTDNTADITTNASAISTLSGSVATLSTTVSAHTTSISTLTGDVATNTANITANASAITTLSGSVSSLSTTVSSHTTSISTLSGAVSTNTANITANATAITTLNGYAAAKYSVTLDVNGYATGFSLFNGGTSYSTATFVVDYFQVAKPGTGGGSPIPVFEIATVNGVAAIAIKGNLIADGSIIARDIAARVITAGKIVVGTLTTEEATGAAFTSMSDTTGATVNNVSNNDIIVSMAYTPSALASGNIAMIFDGDIQAEAADGDPAASTWLEMFIDGVVTLSQLSPGQVVYNSHGLVANQKLRFTTTGALPTGLAINTNYWVKTVLDANHFTVSGTSGGTAINFTSAGSGVHTLAARYGKRRVLTDWISGGAPGQNKIKSSENWIRRYTVSPGVVHNFSVRSGNNDGDANYTDFGADEYTIALPCLILLESKR